jgi:hypothetical protein
MKGGRVEGEKTEDRRQKTEDRRQKTEGRGRLGVGMRFIASSELKASIPYNFHQRAGRNSANIMAARLYIWLPFLRLPYLPPPHKDDYSLLLDS